MLVKAPSITLLLDTVDGGTIKAKDWMRGRVVVTARERIDYGTLSLDVLGKEVAFIRRAGLLASCASGYNDITTLFEQHPILCDFKEIPLETGTSTFPFSVYMPEYLPPSMKYEAGEDGDCSIEYTVGADLNGAVTDRRITVVGAPLVPKHHPNNVEPMCFPLRSRGFRESDSLSFAARVENSRLEKGQPFNLSIAHRNQSSLEVQRVDLRLVETVSWKVGPIEKSRSLLLSTHKGVGLSRRGTPKVRVKNTEGDDVSVAASEYTFTSHTGSYATNPARRGSLTFSEYSESTQVGQSMDGSSHQNGTLDGYLNKSGARKGRLDGFLDGSVHRRGSLDGSVHRRGSLDGSVLRRGSMSSVVEHGPSISGRRGSADGSVTSRADSTHGSVASRRGSLGSRLSQVISGAVPRRRSMFGNAGADERRESLSSIPPPPPESPDMASPRTPRRRRSLFGSAGSECSVGSVRSRRRGSFLGGTPDSEITRKSLVDDDGREHPDVENLRSQLDTVKNQVSIQIPSRTRTSANGELVKVKHFVEAVFVFRDRKSRPRLRIPVQVFEKSKVVDVPAIPKKYIVGDAELDAPDETAHLSDSDTCSNSEH